MPTALIVEERNGRVCINLQREGHRLPEACGEFPFEPVLKPQELADLRWYLEDYLTAPYAVWEDKGPMIREDLPRWGERLFQWLLGMGKPGRDAYIETCRKGSFELWIVSTFPAFLGLPWVLLRDPEQPTPLALGAARINRTIPISAEAAEQVPRDRLRVLMVIARPHGARDVPYQMIARPLLERLEHVSGQVELEVLRPPTVDALRRKLAEATEKEGPFDLLHFDGHGSMAEARSGHALAVSDRYASAEGYLEFETGTGKGDPVSAADFGLILKDAGIPLLVLNACRSGTVLPDFGPEATVATRLIQEGAASVVAMGYSVYAVAAAEQWYKRSLEIKEALGNRPGMASSYGQMGLLAESRGHTTDALDWTIRCVALFPEFPHPATGPGPAQLVRLTARLGINVLEESWQRCTGTPLPDSVRGAVERTLKSPP